MEHNNTVSADDLQLLVQGIQTATAAYDPNADPTAAHVQRAAIREAAAKLSLAASSAEDLVWTKVAGMCEMVNIRMLIRLGVFKAMPLEGSISRADLAQKVNASEGLIERQMRVLVGSGFVDQTLPDGGDYKHTRFSRAFSDSTQPLPGTFYEAMYDVYLRPLVDFDKNFDKYKIDDVITEPMSVFHCPLSHYYGEDGQSGWLALQQNAPDVLKTFSISLTTADLVVPPVGDFFDFSQFKATGPDDDRIQLVDIGGSYGKVLSEIVKATPELDPRKCVLQDIEGPISISQAAQALGIQAQVIDFYTEQPIKGAKAYYMRFISHDYTDDAVVKIIKIIADAMAPDSKLLFGDCVVPPRPSEVGMPAVVLDSVMFCCAGKDRTEKDFRDILGRAGMKLIEIHHVPGRAGAIVESMKA